MHVILSCWYCDGTQTSAAAIRRHGLQTTTWLANNDMATVNQTLAQSIGKSCRGDVQHFDIGKKGVA